MVAHLVGSSDVADLASAAQCYLMVWTGGLKWAENPVVWMPGCMRAVHTAQSALPNPGRLSHKTQRSDSIARRKVG